jgi:uncharacterized membrane protein
MLRFCNHYPHTVWVCIEWYHPNCSDGGNWEKAGWWKIYPGGCKTAYGGDVDDVNRYWYFYAHASDGAHWSGPYWEIVPHIAFDWCENTANTDSRWVGMRELDINGYDNYTVNLVP